MRKTIIAALAFAALSVLSGQAVAGTLTNASIILSDNRAGRPTNLTISFTTDQERPGGHQLFWGMLGAGLEIAASPNCRNNISVHVNDTHIDPATLGICTTFAPDGLHVSVPAGSTLAQGSRVVIVLDKALVNTTTIPGAYTSNIFRTANSSGNNADFPQTQPTYVIAPAPPAPVPVPVPTMTEWAMLLLTAALGGFAALTIQRRRRTV